MGYTKQNFKSGDVLMASQLNAMDEQIAANEVALDKKQPKGDYPTKTEMNQAITNAQLGGGSGETPDLSEYLSKEEASNAYQPKGEYLTKH
jgi:hypothetical protein